MVAQLGTRIIGTTILAVSVALAARVGFIWLSAGTTEGLTAAGRAAGLLGTLLLLLSAVLSARIPKLDRWFGGLTDLWRLHHRLGGLSLLFLMAHPLLLAFAAASGPGGTESAVEALLPPAGAWEFWSGWVALVLMMLFLAPSFAFFGRPAYERWKKLHRLAAPAVVLALVHAAQFGALLPDSLYGALLAALGLTALASLVWHLGLARRFGRLDYRVDRVISIANNVVELSLAPAGRRRLDYRAGQFIYLTPFDRELAAGYGEEHPYTLTSSPEQDNLSVAIKALGDASRAMQCVRPGSRVGVEGPFGDLFPGRESHDQLWIAGGIGIAPFLGRVRHLARTGFGVDIRLVYCVQDEARARFGDELQALDGRFDRFSLHMHFFYRRGPLDLDFLLDCCPDADRREAFVCGPPPLDRLARSLLLDAGVPPRRIRHESFELL